MPPSQHSDREYPSRPIVGVGAVVLDGGAVLLIRRGREPLKGEWSIPGGAVELSERLDAAVAREVLEETGLDIEVGPVVEVVDRIRPGGDANRPRFHYVLVDFLCRPRSPDTATAGSVQTPPARPLTASSDADEARWVGIESLSHYAVAAATMHVIQKAVEIAHSGPWAGSRGYSHLD
ncbi:MAG TPA: NUDIX hydrolase [Vicinamibacterales bacterium]